MIDHDTLEWYNEMEQKYNLKQIERKDIYVSYSEKNYIIITAEK